MNIKLQILVDDQDQLWLVEAERHIPVMTSNTAAASLGVTVRQIYRYFDQGFLKTYGKLCGEWIIDSRSVEALRQAPPTKQPPPLFLQYLFPEYDIKQLNVGKDAPIIVMRIFEHGSVDDLRWLFKRYKRVHLIDCMQRHAGRLLSPKPRRLWSLVLGIKEPTQGRSKDNPWGHADEVA